MPIYNATNGADTLIADGQDDTFIFQPGTIQANDYFDAAGGLDRLYLDGGAGAVFDFRTATLLGFETLQFNSVFAGAVITAALNHTQVSAGLSVIGNGQSQDIIEVYLSPDTSYSAAGWSFTNWTSGAGGDRIFIFGAEGAEIIVGSQQADVLQGRAGNDVLDGNLGADSLDGGAGDDEYWVDDVGDFVGESVGAGTDTVRATITYNLPDYVENLTLTGIAGINGIGNALDNVITGNGAVNQLAGFDGNDVLDGGAGGDSMSGGLGDDTYVVDDPGDQVLESVGQGIDTIQTSIARGLGSNVENGTLTGTAAIGVSGNSLNNTLIGNGSANFLSGMAGADALSGGGGNDTLDGGADADVMIGGAGHDRYLVDYVGDVIVELAGEGADVVESWISVVLADNVEHLQLMGAEPIIGRVMRSTTPFAETMR
jgi:Ca2+-binding RTX toxin-like protein